MPKVSSNNLVFDTSSVISLSMNNLLEILSFLKKRFKGNFLICKSVKEELVDYPLKGKKYKLEALQILKQIKDKNLAVYNEKEIRNKSTELLNIANRIFRADNYIKILDLGEMESLVLSLEINGTLIVDERTMRMLIEDVNGLKEILQKKLHRTLFLNEEALREFKERIKEIKILRSSELVYVAYSFGWFKDLDGVHKKDVLDGLLWGLKLRGCAISSEEITRIERYS